MNKKLFEKIKNEVLKKDAFTLAETLTTLMIIGVISALVIPPLKANLDAKRLDTADKKYQGLIKNALAKMTVNDELRTFTSTEDFIDGLKGQLSIVRTCPSNNLKGCFPDKFKIKTKGETQTKTLSDVKSPEELGQSWETNVVGIVTSDGVSALLAYDADGCKKLKNDQEAQVESCISIMYDLDGIENGNVYTEGVGTSDIGSYNSTPFRLMECGNLVGSDGNPAKWSHNTNEVVHFDGADAKSKYCKDKLSKVICHEPNTPGTDKVCAEGKIADDEISSSGTELTCHCDPSCLAEGTLITLADGSQKRVEDLTFEDELLVWNFDEGRLDAAKPLWIMKKQIAGEYNLLTFSDGRQLKTINQHRIFNKEAGKYTYPMTDDTPIGTTTLLADGSEVTLVDKKVVSERVEYYNVSTEYHFNCFAEGISTSNRFNNLYPIKDYKFVKDNRELVAYDEYKEIPYEWYLKLRLAEQPRDINRDGADNHGDDVNQYVRHLMETNLVPVVNMDLATV